MCVLAYLLDLDLQGKPAVYVKLILPGSLAGSLELVQLFVFPQSLTSCLIVVLPRKTIRCTTIFHQKSSLVCLEVVRPRSLTNCFVTSQLVNLSVALFISVDHLLCRVCISDELCEHMHLL